MKRENLTQADKVLAYLDAHGSISTREAITLLNIKNLSSVFSQLRVLGYESEIFVKQYGNPTATRWRLKDPSGNKCSAKTVEDVKRFEGAGEGRLSIGNEGSERVYVLDGGGSSSSGALLDIPLHIEKWINAEAAKNNIQPIEQVIKTLQWAFAESKTVPENQIPAKSDIDFKIERIKQDAAKAGLSLNVRDCKSTAKQIDIVSSEGWGICWWTTTGTICAAKTIEGGERIIEWYKSCRLSENSLATCVIKDASGIVPFIQNKLSILRRLRVNARTAQRLE